MTRMYKGKLLYTPQAIFFINTFKENFIFPLNLLFLLSKEVIQSKRSADIMISTFNKKKRSNVGRPGNSLGLYIFEI